LLLALLNRKRLADGIRIAAVQFPNPEPLNLQPSTLNTDL
jgi:hypothetical protein